MMNKNLKITLIILNIIMLILAVYWYWKDAEIEPIIVSIGQITSILILLFEKVISKTSVKKISDSLIDIKTEKDDDTDITINKVKKNSQIHINRK